MMSCWLAKGDLGQQQDVQIASWAPFWFVVKIIQFTLFVGIFCFKQVRFFRLYFVVLESFLFCQPVLVRFDF